MSRERWSPPSPASSMGVDRLIAGARGGHRVAVPSRVHLVSGPARLGDPRSPPDRTPEAEDRREVGGHPRNRALLTYHPD